MAQFHDAPDRYIAMMRSALPLYDEMHEALVRATVGVDAGRILDLGTGTGETARRCLDAHPRAVLVGVDSSSSMLAIAESVLGDRATLVHGQLQDALPPGPFDIVVSALAVHHLDEAGKADLFARIADVLAPGGRFVMADVVVADVPVEQPTPLDPALDLPDRLEDLVAWIEDAGLDAAVQWAARDLAVVAGATRGDAPD